MSHFTVLTILRKGTRKSLEDVLAPYDENLEVEQYKYKSKKELIKEGKKQAKEMYKRNKMFYEDVTKFKEEVCEGVESTFKNKEEVLNKYDFRHLASKLATDQEIYEFYKEYYYSDSEFDDEGNLLSIYNPKAKWDWYSIGGRWSGSLILKNGNRDDWALAKEVDWDKMFTASDEQKEYARRFWEIVVEEQPLKEGEDKFDYFTLYNKKYYLEKYKTVEGFIESQNTWGTFAVLTSDKGWHEKGKMGWFGAHSATPKEEAAWDEGFRERFIDTLDPEDEVVIVDCHI